MWKPAPILSEVTPLSRGGKAAASRVVVPEVAVHGQATLSPSDPWFATPQTVENVKWINTPRRVAKCDNDRLLLIPDDNPGEADRVGLDMRMMSGPSLVNRLRKGDRAVPHDARRPLALTVKIDIGLAPISGDVSAVLVASKSNLERRHPSSLPPLPPPSISTPPPVSSLLMDDDEDGDGDGDGGVGDTSYLPPWSAHRSPEALPVPESPLTAKPRRLSILTENGRDGAGGMMAPPAPRMTSPVLHKRSPKPSVVSACRGTVRDSDAESLQHVNPQSVRWVHPRQQSANIKLSPTADTTGGEFILFALVLEKGGRLKFQVTSQWADYKLPWYTVPEHLTDTDGGRGAAVMSVVLGLMEDGVVAVSVSGVLLAVVHLPEAPSKPKYVRLASRDSQYKGSGAFVTSVSHAWLPVPDPDVSTPMKKEFRDHYAPGWICVTGTLVKDLLKWTVDDLWRCLDTPASGDVAMRLYATSIMVATPEAFTTTSGHRKGTGAGAGAGAGGDATKTKKRTRDTQASDQQPRDLSRVCLDEFVQSSELSPTDHTLRLFIHMNADVGGLVGVTHTSLTLMQPFRATLESVFNTDETLRVQRVTRDMLKRVSESPGTMTAAHDDPAYPSAYFEDVPLWK